jgi:DNA invertase Pin-like site-specific DNA recombinase
MKFAATYHRVLAAHEEFTADDRAVWDLVQDRGWSRTGIYADAPGAQRRPGFDRMMEHARAMRFGALVVHSVDLLFRSPRELAELRVELDALKIELVSVVPAPAPRTKVIGRSHAEFSVRHARELRAQGKTFAEIGKELHVGTATVHRAIGNKRRRPRRDTTPDTPPAMLESSPAP